MEASDNHVCSLCQEEYVINNAVTWCVECETFLCFDCDKHHGRIKTTKLHKTITKEDCTNLPHFVLKTKTRCDHHDKQYELFCPFHDCACCVQCITDNHKECRDMKQLADVLKNVKTSAPITRLTEELRNLKGNIRDIGKFLNSRMDAVIEQRENGVSKIQQFRISINDHLDNLERELKERLESECSKMKVNTSKIAEQVERKSKQVEQLLDSTQNLLQFGTELQTFVAIKEIESICDKENKFLEGLKNGKVLTISEITVEMTQDLQSSLNVTSFGDIKVLYKESDLELKEIREEQVQVTCTIGQSKPTLKRMIKLPADKNTFQISGCKILSNGHFVFLDQRNDRVILSNSYGVYYRDVMNHKTPSDLCLIKKTRVAVTFAKDQQICMFEVPEWSQIQTIEVKGQCYGIDSDDKVLFVDIPERKIICVLDLDGKELYKIQVPKFVSRFRVADNQIYCTHFTENSVCCYSMTGSLFWEKTGGEIHGPFGIDIDRTGQVFVTNIKKCTIMVISPDGKEGRVVRSIDDGIEKPVTLDFDIQKSLLLVANMTNGCAFLWQM